MFQNVSACLISFLCISNYLWICVSRHMLFSMFQNAYVSLCRISFVFTHVLKFMIAYMVLCKYILVLGFFFLWLYCSYLIMQEWELAYEGISLCFMQFFCILFYILFLCIFLCVFSGYASTILSDLCICVFVTVYVCHFWSIYISISWCEFVCVCVCVHFCLCVCVHLCMHVCVFVN